MAWVAQFGFTSAPLSIQVPPGVGKTLAPFSRGDFERITAAHPSLKAAIEELHRGLTASNARRSLQRHRVAGLSFLDEADESLLDALSRELELAHFESDEVFATEGEEGDCCYILREGRVSIA